ncbi:helix-turn-helix transcriptional regulator [Arsenicibacter rosenii]|uniref:WYL domain-containing protein n=1 Tax=Arsenicibacter rosenii TaxID=1750698 RepID=A0A1S2VFR4_9BACT|nr:WYL domain-containing protein [Arsenicibacter rosenii]OIN56738.1 WYL domain-containing protein [Arsenicibacter rosenii]
MPITRSAFQRYRLIDELISQYPKQFSKQRLFEICRDKCGIRSVSSLEKDIQRLREDHDAPIAYDKRRDGYYYTDPQFRLLTLMLNPDDMEALDYAREVLAATQGDSVADELSNALQKVRQSLDIIREVKTDTPTRRVVYVEERILGGNRHFVPVLIRAVNQNRQVAFRYSKYDNNDPKAVQEKELPRLRALHPILLREVWDSWYVIGYDEKTGQERTFALDRMSDLEILDEPCNVPESIMNNVSELFNHIYGITDSSGPVEDIVLSFTPLRGRYVKAKPIHQTQEVLSDTDEACVVRLRLAPNRDLMMHLRSYGEDLTVLQPASLAKAIADSFRAALAHYNVYV